MFVTRRQRNGGYTSRLQVYVLGLVLTVAACGGGCDKKKIPIAFGPTTAPIVVKAKVDRSVINIGDKIRYTLAVSAKPGLEFKMPEFGKDVAGFSILDSGRDERTDRNGRKISVQWYLLDTYIVDTYVIKPAPISYTDKTGQATNITAPFVSVRVESLLDQDATKDDALRDVKKPVAFPRPLTVYYVLAGIVILALGIAALIWYVRRRRQRSATPPLAPWQIAYAQLDKLRSMNLPVQGEVSAYYVYLSDIVRHYIENRFGLRAPEMTTEEFLGAVSDSTLLAQDHNALLATFLSRCDMVKFALYGPTETEMEDSFEAAVRFIDETAYGAESEDDAGKEAA